MSVPKILKLICTDCQICPICTVCSSLPNIPILEFSCKNLVNTPRLEINGKIGVLIYKSIEPKWCNNDVLFDPMLVKIVLEKIKRHHTVEYDLKYELDLEYKFNERVREICGCYYMTYAPNAADVNYNLYDVTLFLLEV
jgi:hypothetical protein